ncbi:hypothetical protein Q7C36_016018 [Tachysurus vachellii]|uniref:Uncharacterized protein n=1 Tax=Tachysurus vachellii TaxID=175792 RepID=A0AA88M8Y6_TACVA|nr:hypothetical protein Q7C36_016018 [Tachysurus vachellii]
MADTGQQEVGPCLLPLTDSSAAQKTVTDDDFLDALQKQQMKLEDNNGLLAELVRIEENLRTQEERQRELERVRQEENHQRWRSLCFLILNQRTAKPWVTSYYKNIPMHIYCLPIESVKHQLRKKKKKKKKKEKECN